MNEEKNQKVLAIVLAIAVIGLGVYKLFFSKNNDKDKLDTETISIVTDSNRFYTVAGCIDKYYAYLSSDNKDNLLILLSDEYKKENNITAENIYSYIKKMDNFYTFSPSIMYYQRLSKDTYKYYVSGSLEGTYLNFKGEPEEIYIVVILDESNTTFAIEPYDGEIFNK